jgi:hypothetical protein
MNPGGRFWLRLEVNIEVAKELSCNILVVRFVTTEDRWGEFSSALTLWRGSPSFSSSWSPILINYSIVVVSVVLPINPYGSSIEFRNFSSK